MLPPRSSARRTAASATVADKQVPVQIAHGAATLSLLALSATSAALGPVHTGGYSWKALLGMLAAYEGIGAGIALGFIIYVNHGQWTSAVRTGATNAVNNATAAANSASNGVPTYA